ncbi:hypothetical protein [Rhizobium rhizosphaerae]|uniref:hypothetical protein n=1 Tax=Xaviernesmea rhizosphaerae TaxID=1672749 RepID=UPI001179C5B5|nr:hypothetical protein [Xaviernesmea rhizosphaerae]
MSEALREKRLFVRIVVLGLIGRKQASSMVAATRPDGSPAGGFARRLMFLRCAATSPLPQDVPHILRLLFLLHAAGHDRQQSVQDLLLV